MIDREKVIKGLGEALVLLAEYVPGERYLGYAPGACLDAIEMLKAQQSRVMTLEDFENNPNVDQYGCLPCWMEYREEPKWDGWAEATVHTCVEYGRRPWTSRPTDEQREAEPWASDT